MKPVFTARSASGRRAHAPAWWGKLVSSFPHFRVPWLHPGTWTPELARAWVDRIPAKCPFERQLWVGNLLVLYVPPLCPLNPVSTQLYEIRLEAQQYLAKVDTF